MGKKAAIPWGCASDLVDQGSEDEYPDLSEGERKKG